MRLSIPNRKMFLMIILIGTLPQIFTDMYTPALTSIMHDLQSTAGEAQRSITYLMLGLCMSTLLYGPLAEYYGRRNTIIFGLFIVLVGTVLCQYSQHITTLQWGRWLQGLGLGAASSLWRTLLKDTYDHQTLSMVLGPLVVLVTLSAMLAPFVGGYIAHYFCWQTIFHCMNLWLVLVLALSAAVLPANHLKTTQPHLKFTIIIANYRRLITSPTFLGACSITLAAYGGLFSWLTIGPLLLMKICRLSAVDYGHVMFITGLTYGVAGLYSSYLNQKYRHVQLIKSGLFGMLLASILFVITTLVFGNNPLLICALTVVFLFSITLIFNNCFTWAFEFVGDIAGYAGAMYSFIQLLGAVAFTTLASHIPVLNAWPLVIMYSLSAIVGMSALYLTLRTAKKLNH